MSKLNNVPQINQTELLNLYKFGIVEHENVMVLGPAGAGKTEMAVQAAEEADKASIEAFDQIDGTNGDYIGYNLIYWNMSVMERPDIQGLPAISEDKMSSTFAPQEGMPFEGMFLSKKIRQINSIKELIELTKFSNEDTINQVKELDYDLNKELLQLKLKQAGLPHNFENKQLVKNVLLIDEVDKTPPENLQPLLELLQTRSINGRALDIETVFLTANLPDEHTYSEPISHALTARCMVVELKPDWKIWLDWASSQGLYGPVIAFLSKEDNAIEYMNRRPSNNDVYTYTYTSPRHWTRVGRMNVKLDSMVNKGIFTAEQADKLRLKFNSSIIGVEAATKFDVWIKFYRKYDKFIDQLFNMQELGPDFEQVIQSESIDDNAQDSMSNSYKVEFAKTIIAIALASRIRSFSLRTDDKEHLEQLLNFFIDWVENNVVPDAKLCAYKVSYDQKASEKHGYKNFKCYINKIISIYKSLTNYSKNSDKVDSLEEDPKTEVSTYAAE